MVLTLAIATPVAANDRPDPIVITQHNVLTNPTACGSYGVEWDIHLTVEIWTKFDDQGRRTKVIQHITEDNTVKNTVTGLTLRDGPVDFIQTNNYNPETGALATISITGVAVNVQRGDEKLVDLGPILIDGPTRRIIRSAGNHPVRELMDGSTNINLALPAFCHILR
jgi:hypothetical protein